MTIRFDTLFTLRVSNAYYVRQAADFEFLIPPATQRLLKNRKLLAKALNGNVHVLFEADDAGTPLSTATGEKIAIGLRLINPGFFNVAAVGMASGSTALFTNAVTADALDSLLEVNLTGALLAHTLTDSARPATLELLSPSNQTIAAETITSVNDRASVAFELTTMSPGAYSVQETFPGNVTTQTRYYFDSELLAARVFGIVEISVGANFYTTPPDFEIHFDARSETLKYYVVTHKYSNADLALLSVSDQGFTEDSRPEITFAKVDAADFTSGDLAPSLFGSGDAKVVLFKSQAAVARSAKSRKKIQLKRNGNLLIEHLPQPGADRATADMIIHVSKP